MALAPVPPIPARVNWDRRRHRPSNVRIGARRLVVTAVDAVRDETAAFPAHRGPRLTLLVATDHGPASLVYDRAHRRWYVEAIDDAA